MYKMKEEKEMSKLIMTNGSYIQVVNEKTCLFQIRKNGTTKVYDFVNGKLKFNGRIPF